MGLWLVVFRKPDSICCIFLEGETDTPTSSYLLQKLKESIRSCLLGKETESSTRISLCPTVKIRRVREEEEGQVKGREVRRGGQHEGMSYPLLGHQQLFLSTLLLDVVVLHLHLMGQLQPLLKGIWSVPGAV